MKKAFVLLCAFAALLACSKNDFSAPPDNGTDKEETTHFTFKVTVDAPKTKAESKSVWLGGDIIYVKFHGINNKYLILTYNAGTSSWDVAQSTPFTGYDFDGAGSKICHAIYFPVSVTPKFTTFSEKQILEFVTAADAWPATYYLEHQNAPYKVSGTDVTLNLCLTIPANSVLFHIPGLQTTFTGYDFRVSNVLPRAVRGIQDDGIKYTLPSGPLAGFADVEGVVYSGYIVSPGTELDYYFYLCKGDSYTIFEKTCALTSGSFYKFKALDDASHMWKTTRLIGKFSVSAEKKVHFSQGNLRFVLVATWRFAENQWESFGASQSDNHRDLFGWGKTQDNYPNNVSENENDYSWFDWGNNIIRNGGNFFGFGWRTLTRAEWGYLLGIPESEFLTHRTDAASKYGFATVNGIKGLILLPDEWTTPTMNATHTNFTDNTITSSDWLTSWEPKGAVFLPVTGSRMGMTVNRETDGFYWTSTQGENGIGAVIISPSLKESGHDGVYNDPPSNSKAAGFAVRLVRDVVFNF
ncbi:MAG: hypothetical protein J5604_04470 [Bacteroidales bacterium]|nr:hypothetical protein [Bacteroidales bacterium]